MTDLLPAVSGDTALEMADKLTLALGTPEIFTHLPLELAEFLKQRFVIPAENTQPEMPLMGDSSSLRVTYLKKIGGMTKDKAFAGVDQPIGTILGKTPFTKPFPFIVLLAWRTRQKGYFDAMENRMVVHCESRDGIKPSMINDWGALTCGACPYHPSQRPNWNDETEESRKERCKQRISVLGVGGDWRDLYILPVGGLGIIDFYSKQIGKEISAVKDIGQPYFMRTFMVSTEKDSRGNHQYAIEGVLPTLRTPDLPDDAEVYWDFDENERDERNAVTMAALSNIQKLAAKYRDEFQAVGRAALQAQLEMEEKLQLDGDTDDSTEEERATAAEMGLD